jgi:hypothetical protein
MGKLETLFDHHNTNLKLRCLEADVLSASLSPRLDTNKCALPKRWLYFPVADGDAQTAFEGAAFITDLGADRGPIYTQCNNACKIHPMIGECACVYTF